MTADQTLSDYHRALLEAIGEDAALAWLVERGRLTRETAEETVEPLERWVSPRWEVQ